MFCRAGKILPFWINELQIASPHIDGRLKRHQLRGSRFPVFYSPGRPLREEKPSATFAIFLSISIVMATTDSVSNPPSQSQLVDTNPLPAWVNPDWDRLLQVVPSGGSFRSKAISLVDLPAGSLFARLTGINAQTPQSYSTTQAARDLHVELNSNIHFTNHSCDPTLEWHMDKFDIYVRRDRDLKKGDMLCFFYPSTDWTLAQPFDCWCGAPEGVCCGRIEGAEKMSEEVLNRYWLNTYIRELLEERRQREQKA